MAVLKVVYLVVWTVDEWVDQMAEKMVASLAEKMVVYLAVL